MICACNWPIAGPSSLWIWASVASASARFFEGSDTSAKCGPAGTGTLAVGAGAGTAPAGAATEGLPCKLGIGSSFGAGAATADAGGDLTTDAVGEAGAFGADADAGGVRTGAAATAEATRAAGGATT
jgi:hypothetical protein